MAAIGKNAVYQQLRAPDDTITADIQYWNQDSAIRRRENQEAEQTAYKRMLDESKKKQERYDKFVKPLNNYDTGSQSLNEVQGRLLQKAVEKYPELLETLEKAPQGSKEYLNAQLGLQNLNSLPERLKDFTDYYTNQNQEYLERVKNGEIFRDEDYEKVFSGGFKNIQLGLDDQFKPVVAFIDNDGDGIADKPSGRLINFQSYDNIQKAVPEFQFLDKFNFEGAISQMAKDLGTVEVTNEEGYTEVKNKGVDVKALNMMVDKLFSSDKVYRAGYKEYGLEPSPENTAKMKEDFKKSVLAQTDTFSSRTTNFTAQNQARDDARAAANKNKTGVSAEPVEATEAVYGEKIKTVDPNFNSVRVSPVEIPPIKGEDGEFISNAVALNYTYDRSGNMIVDVEIPVSKSISVTSFGELEKKVEQGTATEEEIKQLRTAKRVDGKGNYRITVPGQSERRAVVLNKSDEEKVASSLGGIKAAKDKAKKSPGAQSNNDDDPLGIL
jgi:hypothetical protein